MSEIKFQHGHLGKFRHLFLPQERLTVKHWPWILLSREKKDNFEKKKQKQNKNIVLKKKCFSKDGESQ